MNTVRVNLGHRSYDIYIGSGILDRLGSWVREVTAGDKALVVSNSTVFGFYGEAVSRSLAAAAPACGRSLALVSRSDSTLRGHFPGELRALAAKGRLPVTTTLLGLGAVDEGDEAANGREDLAIDLVARPGGTP